VRNIMPISEFRDVPIEMKPVAERLGIRTEDDEASRFSRIRDFEKKSANSTINLDEAINPNFILGDGEQVVASLACNEIRGHPSSTKGTSDVTGLCNVSLIKGPNGFARLNISVVEGEYTFKGDELFFDYRALSKIGCCCIFSCFRGGDASSMSMHYELQRKVLTQDVSLPIHDSIIDAMLYRKSFVKSTAGIGSFDIALTGGCYPCGPLFYECYKFYLSQMKLWFICSMNMYRLHPILRKFLCCECGISCECIFQKLFCWKSGGRDESREISFSVEDKYVIGKEYNKQPVKDRFENKEPTQTVWLNCPVYCCGVCFQYPDPMLFFDSFFKKIGAEVYYPCSTCAPLACANPRKYLKEEEEKKLEWKSTTDIKNEIVLIVHYRHPVDDKTKSFELVIKPSEKQVVDELYRNARKFIGQLSSLRGSLHLEMKDRSAGSRNEVKLDAVNNDLSTATDSSFMGLAAGKVFSGLGSDLGKLLKGESSVKAP